MIPKSNFINAFSASYVEARERFLSAAREVNADFQVYKIAARGITGEELTIDIATIGAKQPERVVWVTSGLHGVEGYLGSAIQTEWLRRFKNTPQSLDRTAIVLTHSLNPYGFSWQRRVNENNVDLNRNFVVDDHSFRGSAPIIQKIKWLQEPVSPQRLFFDAELYLFWHILVHGFPAMKNALLNGQFDYPSALFWGGRQYEEATRLIQEQAFSWTRQAPYVLHLDFHTGLGKYACCHLLSFQKEEMPRTIWLQSKFGRTVEPLGQGLVSSTLSKGIMGQWLNDHFARHKKNYAYLTAEFGTLKPTQVFKALYDENRFHNHPGSGQKRAKKGIMEAFCPSDPVWRTTCLTEGIYTIDKSLEVINDDW